MTGWLLRYEGSARDPLLELRPAIAGVGDRLDALLAEYAGRQDSRIEAIAAYARGVSCRHRAIGKLKIVNIPIPAFDEADEWFD